MLGILVALALSWLLLYLFNRSGLEELGLFPTTQRASQLLYGLAISAFCSFLYFGVILLISGSNVAINKNFHVTDLLASSWWITRSVLFEEFLFRGALLYLAVRLLGSKKALILSAVIFGIYHWFSYQVFGDMFQMAVVFLLTATAGFVFAYSFIKTKSMYLQTGLHFGWNFMVIIVFSNGPLGKQLLLITEGHKLGTVLSLLLLLIQLILMPLVTMLYLKWRFQSGAEINNN